MDREWDDYESDEQLPTIPLTWNNQKLFQTVDIPTFVLVPQSTQVIKPPSPTVVVKPPSTQVIKPPSPQVIKPRGPVVPKKTNTNSFMLLNTASDLDSDSESN